jgi:hypothetical protein
MVTNNTIKQRSRVGVRQWRWVVGIGLVLAACGAPAAETPASPTPATDIAPSPTGDASGAGGTMLAGQNLDEALVQQAQQRLAQHLNLPSNEPILENGSEQAWPTSALGCPVPDQLYTQVVTPGYLLVFIANNQPQAVHTNADGSQAVLCENNAPVPLPPVE